MAAAMAVTAVRYLAVKTVTPATAKTTSGTGLFCRNGPFSGMTAGQTSPSICRCGYTEQTKEKPSS